MEVSHFRPSTQLPSWRTPDFSRPLVVARIPIPYDAVTVTMTFHSRKNDSRCLQIVFAFSGQNQAHKFDEHVSHECPFKHADGGVSCQGASMLPTSPLHGCSFQLVFQTILPTYTLQLLSLSEVLLKQAGTCH